MRRAFIQTFIVSLSRCLSSLGRRQTFPLLPVHRQLPQSRSEEASQLLQHERFDWTLCSWSVITHAISLAPLEGITRVSECVVTPSMRSVCMCTSFINIQAVCLCVWVCVCVCFIMKNMKKTSVWEKHTYTHVHTFGNNLTLRLLNTSPEHHLAKQAISPTVFLSGPRSQTSHQTAQWSSVQLSILERVQCILNVNPKGQI